MAVSAPPWRSYLPRRLAWESSLTRRSSPRRNKATLEADDRRSGKVRQGPVEKGADQGQVDLDLIVVQRHAPFQRGPAALSNELSTPVGCPVGAEPASSRPVLRSTMSGHGSVYGRSGR